jgi:hypothetical protein
MRGSTRDGSLGNRRDSLQEWFKYEMQLRVGVRSATVTKGPEQVASTTQIDFLVVLRARGPRSWYQLCSFLVRILSALQVAIFTVCLHMAR